MPTGTLAGATLTPAPTRQPDDVERAQRGDAQAFRRLYMATADRMHRLARWLLHSGDVDDAVQDVYLRAWERLPDLRDPRTFDGWLRRVAVTVILRRREQTARTRSREDELSAAAEAPAREAPAGLALDLEHAIARLPGGARDVFVLYDVEGHDHGEIGRMLGISPHTSRSQLHRARTLLKHVLKEEP